MLERTFNVAGMPLLVIAQDDRPRPVVLFYHGLHSSKETHRKELDSLAAQGWLAVGVDAVGHGQRPLPDLRAFLGAGELVEQARKLLRPTLAELPLLVDFLQAEGYGPFVLCGISFGAMLAYAAPYYESRLRGVVAVLGDPDWFVGDVSQYPQIPLLAWNGGQDVHVPAEPARRFMGQLANQGRPHCQYYEYAESDHFMRPQDWEDGWQRTLDWVRQRLAQDTDGFCPIR